MSRILLSFFSFVGWCRKCPGFVEWQLIFALPSIAFCQCQWLDLVAGWKYTGGAGCLTGTNLPSGQVAFHTMTIGLFLLLLAGCDCVDPGGVSGVWTQFAAGMKGLASGLNLTLLEDDVVVDAGVTKVCCGGSGMAGYPGQGLAITVTPGGIGLAIMTPLLCSGEGKGPEKKVI